MDREGGVDPFVRLKEAPQEYKVYDSHYERLGRVDDLISSEDGQVLYIGVKMGFFGTNSTLIPAEIIRVNDRRHLIEVSEPAETIRHAPHFGSVEELTPELENHVRTYFGLESLRPSPEHEPQGPDIPEEPAASQPVPEDWVETVPIERVETQERPAPVSEDSEVEPPEEPTPERTEPDEAADGRESTPEEASSEEPLAETPERRTGETTENR